MTSVLIEVRGCDATTKIITSYNEEQIGFLENFCKQIALASDGCCRPDISYYTVPNEAVSLYKKWKKIDENIYSEPELLTEEEKEFYYSKFYNYYWLIDQAVEPKFNASQFRKEVYNI